jgi:hypothetical protein
LDPVLGLLSPKVAGVIERQWECEWRVGGISQPKCSRSIAGSDTNSCTTLL